MLKTLLTLRLILSFFRMFPLLFIGLGAVLYGGLKQVTGNAPPGGYWKRDTTPMINFKKIDEERIQNGLPVLR
jgi:hypothetical protein